MKRAIRVRLAEILASLPYPVEDWYRQNMGGSCNQKASICGNQPHDLSNPSDVDESGPDGGFRVIVRRAR